jgi:hypothetical protein
VVISMFVHLVFMFDTHQVTCWEDANAREVLEIRLQFMIPRREARVSFTVNFFMVYPTQVVPASITLYHCQQFLGFLFFLSELL